MIKQKWIVTVDENDHCIEYTYSSLGGKTVLVVDGESFTVKAKTFSLGLARRESIIVGDVQAVLDIAHNGKAQLICREGSVKQA